MAKQNSSQVKGSSRKVGRTKRKLANKGKPLSLFVRNKITFEAYLKATKV